MILGFSILESNPKNLMIRLRELLRVLGLGVVGGVGMPGRGLP